MASVTRIVTAVFMSVLMNNLVGGDPNRGVLDQFCTIRQALPPTLYSQCRDDLLPQIIDGTPSHGYNYSFSFANSSAPRCDIVFGHGACNGKLTQDDCAACLRAALGEMNQNCRFGVGAWIKLVDCRMKYENHLFGPNY